MSTEKHHPAETPETTPSHTAPGPSSGPDGIPDASAAAAAPAMQGEPSASTPPEAAAAGQKPARPADETSPIHMPEARSPRDDPTARPQGDSAAELTRPGPASRLFGGLSMVGLPVLVALTALMTAAQLLSPRSLWFSDEVRLADVYMRLQEGNWLTLNLNGLPYADNPPLYFWFLELLDRIPGVDQPLLFFLGTSLSAVLFIAVTWLLARATGHDRRTSFAAGLVALGCLFVAGAAHYSRMDLLFAVLITLSLLCLYRGWIKKSAPVWLTLGFVLAAAATLLESPLGLAFPLLTSLLFLIWRGTPGRLNGRDGLLGFALMLIILLTWLGALLLQGESDYVRDIFSRQIAGRLVNAGHHAWPWWYYLAALPLVWLPWTLALPFVNWWKAARHLPEAWKTRREDGGRGWLWLTIIGGVALLSALSGKSVTGLLPLLPALAVLSARSLLRLSPCRSRCFFGLLGLLFGLTGLILVAAQFSSYVLPRLPETWTTELPALAQVYLDNSAGLALMGAVLLLLSVVLLFLTRRSLPDGSLLLTSLGMVLLMQPYSLVVAPSLETMLSPRAQAEAMSEYVRQGYAPAAYRVYPGVYAYYVNETLAAAAPDQPRPRVTVPVLSDSAALAAFLAEHPRAVVAMPEKDWLRWKDKPSDIFEAQRQWMLDQSCVLTVRDATGEIPPSQEESAPPSGQVPEKSTLSPEPEEASDGTGERNAAESGDSGAALLVEDKGEPALPAPEAGAPAPAGAAQPAMPDIPPAPLAPPPPSPAPTDAEDFAMPDAPSAPDEGGVPQAGESGGTMNL